MFSNNFSRWYFAQPFTFLIKAIYGVELSTINIFLEVLKLLDHKFTQTFYSNYFITIE